jgi:hypothetical protein
LIIKINNMKIVLSLLFSIGFATLILTNSCTKIESTFFSFDPVFVEEIKTWYQKDFKNTSEYTKGMAANNIKVPDWKYAHTYNIGKIQFAEFPLILDRKSVLITENLSEFDKKKVVSKTCTKILFIKGASKQIEVRIIQFTPTLKYLQNKNFDISRLSFENYKKDFNGDFMMFDFENNFKSGYHFVDKLVKKISLNKNKTLSKQKTNTSSSTTEKQNPVEWGPSCDNLQPNCKYTLTAEYEIRSKGGGGHNCYESFNPDFCDIVIIDISCTLEYCDSKLGDDCVDGIGSEACICAMFGICGSPPPSPSNCDNEAERIRKEFDDYVKMSAQPSTFNSAPSNAGPDPKSGSYTWIVVEALFGSWHIEAKTEFAYYHTTITNVQMQRSEVFNIITYKTVATKFVGSNIVIKTTWAADPPDDKIFNNNSEDAEGIANVSGTVTHVQNPVAVILGCPPIPILNVTETADNSNHFFPN